MHGWLVQLSWPMCLVGVLLLVTGPSACIRAPETTAPPATSSTAVAAQGMAMLEGFATTIDGKYTRGDAGPVELVPGCHVITTTANVPTYTGRHSTGPMRVPKAYFVMVAEAGHRYVIERVLQPIDYRWRRMLVTMKDIDAKGRVVSTFSSFGGDKSPEGCPARMP
jgi:hypothetical protein